MGEKLGFYQLTNFIMNIVGLVIFRSKGVHCSGLLWSDDVCSCHSMVKAAVMKVMDFYDDF